MSIEAQIIGTSWRLVSFQSEDKFGEIIYPLGKEAQGVIMFTLDHRMAVQIMAADRDVSVEQSLLDTFNTESEKEMAKLGYHAYSGPIDIDEEAGTLTTHVELSLVASYVGSDQTRSAKIENDRLYLSNVKHPERKLVWERINR